MGLKIETGLNIGRMKKGPKNLITDVPGVLVGHSTINDGEIKTGVTAVLPHNGNLFKDKVMAACHVINGFGKSIGLIQIDELGTIETPLIMTNTLSVGTAATALVKYMLKENDDIGVTTGTVNCVVTECNDGTLNDIRGLHVKEENVFEALDNASDVFEEGAVGSGTGMCCLGFKGGIGSASRIVEFDGREYTLGAIVMSNFGGKGNLIVDGDKVGERMLREEAVLEGADKGSIIMVLATDVPLSERQLRRVAKRSVIGLGRTGSYLGNGSGDICIAFSTANRVKHYSDTDIFSIGMVSDDKIDSLFRAAAETVEESVISALWHANSTVGFRGNRRESLRDYLER